MTAHTKPRRLGDWSEAWVPDYVVYEGRVWSMAAWTAATGISGHMIGDRIHRQGWDDCRALVTGIRGKKVVKLPE
jgi:hypothetical protein